MQSLLLLFFALVAAEALTTFGKSKAKQYHQECFEASGADPVLVVKARQGDFIDDAKFKEHLFCFSKKAGFQNDAGDLQRDVLESKLAYEFDDEAEAAKLVAKCAVQKETPQDTAFDTLKCYYGAIHGYKDF